VTRKKRSGVIDAAKFENREECRCSYVLIDKKPERFDERLVPTRHPFPTPSPAMNRRHFLWTSILAAGATHGLLHAADKAPAAGTPIKTGAPVPGVPYVTSPTADGVAVVWSVDSPCTGWVEYGETPELGMTARGAQDGLRPFDERVISVRLTGLKPGAKVHYRTVTAPVSFPNHYKIKRGEAVASPVFAFTLPGESPSVKIVTWNDTHQQKATLQALDKFTEELAPDLLVWNGDMVADQFVNEDDFTKTFLPRTPDFAPASKRVLLFNRGNHDARGPLARHLPQYAPRARADGYHNLIRVGPVAVITLDTGDDKEGPTIYGDLGEFAAYREAQRVWLESAVKDPRFTSAPFRIVFAHIPLRWKILEDAGSQCFDGAARWSALLAKAGVQAVISGHVHEHWHAAPDAEFGFHQITGGGPLVKRDTKPENEAKKLALETALSNPALKGKGDPVKTRRDVDAFNSVKGWSPTPAAPVIIEATASAMRIRVVEAVSRKELLNLEFKA
jgi:hypothetical protein